MITVMTPQEMNMDAKAGPIWPGASLRALKVLSHVYLSDDFCMLTQRMDPEVVPSLVVMPIEN